MVVAGLVALAQSVAVAGESAAQYSVGKSGSRLTWLPQRPESAQSGTSVTAAQHTVPVASPRLVRMTQNQNPALGPLDGPFDEKKTPTPASTPAPAEKISDELPQELPQQMPVEPRAESPLPGLSPEQSIVAEKSSGSPTSSAAKPKKYEHKNPVIERESALGQHEYQENCPSPKDLKPVDELTTNIIPPEGELPHDCPLGNATFQPRAFAPVTYAWTASGLCHKPLYFEDEQLERYGHMAGPWVQPFASAAHFFLTIPILPYKMGLETPNECLYTLGYYRPGSCAPYLFDPLPLSVRGALFEAGAWVGGAIVIP